MTIAKKLTRLSTPPSPLKYRLPRIHSQEQVVFSKLANGQADSTRVWRDPFLKENQPARVWVRRNRTETLLPHRELMAAFRRAPQLLSGMLLVFFPLAVVPEWSVRKG